MKSLPIFPITLIALVLCFAANGARPYFELKPAWCTDTGGASLWTDNNCISRPDYLLIPDFWLKEAMKINNDRCYGNYDKIICALGDIEEGMYQVCAFIDGIPPEGPLVSGFQIKRLFRHLATWCDRSRCGKCPISRVAGPAREGWFNIDGVDSMGSCRGLCEPDKDTSLSQNIQCYQDSWF